MLDDQIEQLFSKYPQTTSMHWIKEITLDQIHLFINHELKEGKNSTEVEKKVNKYLKSLSKFLDQLTNYETIDHKDFNKVLSKAFGLKFVNEVEVSLNEIDELHFNYRISDLLILPSNETDKLIVRDFMSRDISKLYSNIEKIGNVIKITQGPKKLIGFFKNKVIILLPKKYTGFLTIRSAAGNTSFNKLDQNCMVDITSINGDVLFRNCTISRLQADVKHGDITLKNTTATDMHINTHSGEISVESAHIDTTDGELGLRTTSGKIKIDDVITKRLIINTKSGAVSGNNIHSHLGDIEVDSGNIHLNDFCSGGNIISQTGKIKLNLSKNLTEELKIRSRVGNINIYVPPLLNFRFLLSTRIGSIDLPMDAMIYAENEYDSLKGYVGQENATANLIINNEVGKIYIKNIESTKKHEK